MSPITHFLATWVCLEQGLERRRDKALVMAAGLLPDLDGMGIVVDFGSRLLGFPETTYYQDSHRLYGHGIAGALVISLLCAAMVNRRWRVAAWCFLAVHLHYLCDILGSRGSTPEDLWGIHYLAPFSLSGEWVWAGQWPLVGWQNMLISLILMGVVLWRAAHRGYSPVLLFSPRADARFVAILRQRLARWL